MPCPICGEQHATLRLCKICWKSHTKGCPKMHLDKGSSLRLGKINTTNSVMLDMMAKLAEPAAIHEGLEKFLVWIYQNSKFVGKKFNRGIYRQLMRSFDKATLARGIRKEQPTLAREIYDLYTGFGLTQQEKKVTNNEIAEFVDEIYGLHQDGYKGHLQYIEKKREREDQDCNIYVDEVYKKMMGMLEAKNFNFYADDTLAGYLKDFIKFDNAHWGTRRTQEDITHRIYLSPKLAHRCTALGLVLESMAGDLKYEIYSCKTGGIIEHYKKGDRIVVYCTNTGLNRLMRKLKMRLPPTKMDDALPGMLKINSKGIGSAAEPTFVPTGLFDVAPPDQEYSDTVNTILRMDAESRCSFGQICSSLVATAVMHYNDNHAVLGQSFNLLCRFVNVAFKNYGLDPEDPCKRIPMDHSYKVMLKKYVVSSAQRISIYRNLRMNNPGLFPDLGLSG